MRDFDVYVAALRQRLWNRLSADAERELRAHFQEAVADLEAEGLPREQAEAVALERLGNVEDVARAFAREQSPLIYRLVGGPLIAVLADVRNSWRLALIATALATLAGAFAGQFLAPTYVATVRIGLESDRLDYGLTLAVNQAIEDLHSQLQIPVIPLNGVQDRQWAAVEVRAANRESAIRQAREEAQRVIRAFPAAFQGTPFGNGDRSVRLQTIGEPAVRAAHPTILTAALGTVSGLIATGVATRRRRTRR